MQAVFIDYIYLILIILALVMVANKLRLAYPIVLVIGGLALSFVPTFSNVTINPDFIFFIFLPPLLYEAAWQVSWKEFWRWRRVIMSFAFPIVILTSTAIAIFSNALIPGFTLALGFLLGGIISPPDAISATTIMRQVKAPRTMVSIVEGESLLNDAASLIVFRFASLAITTGQFSIGRATKEFFLVITLGIVIGLAVGFIFYVIHRWLPTTPSIEIVLTLVTPYCMYYAAEHFHYSGVLAVVSGGLFLSNRRNVMLNYRSRIQGLNVWSVLGFVLNGIIFLLIGLEMPTIIRQLDLPLSQAIWYGLAISGALIIIRLLCTLGASVFTRIMSNFITVAVRNPGWRGPIVLGWAGMRGVVSLAAALSIPLLSQGQAFPYRNLILFITFIVILVTLVFQGLTLPWVIRKMKLTDSLDGVAPIPMDKQELIIQKKIAHTSINYLETKDPAEWGSNEHLNNLSARFKLDLNYFTDGLQGNNNTDEAPLRKFHYLYLDLLEQQRKLLIDMNHRQEFDEELIRKYLSLIDLEEFKVREKMQG